MLSILYLGLLIFCFSNPLIPQTGASNYYKFPEMINYKLRKNAKKLDERKVLICKGKKSPLLQSAFHTQYPVANLPALFLIAAKKVYADEKGV